MPEYPVPQSVQDNWDKRFAHIARLHPCGEGISEGLTCQMPTRQLFPRGWRCAGCAPAQPVIDPELTLAALQARARARAELEQDAA